MAKITGTLAGAGVTRNGNLYLPEELSKMSGVVIDIYDASPVDSKGDLVPRDAVGHATLRWDPDRKVVAFEGKVSKAAAKMLKEGQSVVLFAEPESFEVFKGARVPIGLKFVKGVISPDPSDPRAETRVG